jgi:hypothetical protein
LHYYSITVAVSSTRGRTVKNAGKQAKIKEILPVKLSHTLARSGRSGGTHGAGPVFGL